MHFCKFVSVLHERFSQKISAFGSKLEHDKKVVFFTFYFKLMNPNFKLSEKVI